MAFEYIPAGARVRADQGVPVAQKNKYDGWDYTELDIDYRGIPGGEATGVIALGQYDKLVIGSTTVKDHREPSQLVRLRTYTRVADAGKEKVVKWWDKEKGRECTAIVVPFVQDVHSTSQRWTPPRVVSN
jgi:hypothetical protein